MSQQQDNGLQNVNEPLNPSGRNRFSSDSFKQLVEKFNQNNKIIITKNDDLGGAGLLWDNEERALSLNLSDGNIFIGTSEGVEQKDLQEAIEESDSIGNTVRFVADIPTLRTLSGDHYPACIVGDATDAPGTQAYFYEYNDSSTRNDDPPNVIRPDSVDAQNPGRWEITTSIPLDLEEIILYNENPGEVAQRPVPQDRLQVYVVQGGTTDGVEHPPGIYQWDSGVINNGEGHIKPESLGGSQPGRWIRQTGGLNEPLLGDNNLSDIPNPEQARNNLGLESAAVRAASTFLDVADNLSDLDDDAEARDNLGLGSAAQQSTDTFLQTANNLDDLGDDRVARINLGLPDSDGSSDPAAFYTEDHFFVVESNLSELTDTNAARTHLGLGSAATTNAEAYLSNDNSNFLGEIGAGTEDQRETARQNLGMPGEDDDAALFRANAFLVRSNDLSDVDPETARFHLDLGELATLNEADVLLNRDANPLVEINTGADVDIIAEKQAAARINLGMPGVPDLDENDIKDAALYSEDYFIRTSENDTPSGDYTFTGDLTLAGNLTLASDFQAVTMNSPSNNHEFVVNVNNAFTDLVLSRTGGSQSQQLRITNNVGGDSAINISCPSGGVGISAETLAFFGFLTVPLETESSIRLYNDRDETDQDSLTINVGEDFAEIRHVGGEDEDNEKYLRIVNEQSDGEAIDTLEIGEDYDEVGSKIRFNGTPVWNGENDGEGSGLDADMLDGKDSDFYLEIKNFYNRRPRGYRIHVSESTGDDSNYGFVPENSVRTIKEAATVAFSLQAPDTLEGNLRRDAVKALSRNRTIIVEEVFARLKTAYQPLPPEEQHQIFPGLNCGLDARSPRDIGLIYDALVRDLLLGGNQETLKAFNKLFDAFNTLPQANIFNRDAIMNIWDGVFDQAQWSLGLMGNMVPLMERAIIAELRVEDFLETTVQRSQIYDDHDTGDDDNPCGFIVDQLNSLRQLLRTNHENDCNAVQAHEGIIAPQRPDGEWLNIVPPISPNQANRLPFSTIMIESGTYAEEMPIYLPDRVTILGDSLRRTTIIPTQSVRKRGCGLHEAIRQSTFRGLVLNPEDESQQWYIDLYVEVGDEAPIHGMSQETLNDIASRRNAQLSQAFIDPAGGVVIDIQRTGTDINSSDPDINNPILLKIRVETPDSDGSFFPNVLGFDRANGIQIETPEREDPLLASTQGFLRRTDFFRGFLLLKDANNNPITINDNNNYQRGEEMTPTTTLSALPNIPKEAKNSFENGLRKGDVLLIVDPNNNRQEKVRVDGTEVRGGTVQLRLIPHECNEAISPGNGSIIYMAPRTYWQTECIRNTPENGYSDVSNSYPSFITQTNTAEVGQYAFTIGNANYITQVNFKETTNFSFAFRTDVPRIYASPYIQNCSSLSTFGGGGILVDGKRPRQPENDLPRQIDNDSNLTVDEWLGSDDYNKNIDASNLLKIHEQAIVNNTIAGIEADGADWLEEFGEKCRRDMSFIIESISWQLLRGGNDRVYDYAVIINEAITKQAEKQAEENEETDAAAELSIIRDRYRVVLETGGFLRTEMAQAIEGNDGYDRGSVTGGDCSDVVSGLNAMMNIYEGIIANGDDPETVTTRTSNFGEPWFVLNRGQNAELRSFVLDAFTQINTFGGRGHLIRENGYAQLVSTFTTFCDIGVKVESGGLVNLSNSVTDFGWLGLVADGLSEFPYLQLRVARDEVGVDSNNIPKREIYLKALVGDDDGYLENNLVFAEREEQSVLKEDENGDDLEGEDASKAVVKAIQLNSTFLLFEDRNISGAVYDFDGSGAHLASSRQIPRLVEIADWEGEPKSDIPYKRIEDGDGEIIPTVRIIFPVDQRIPGRDVTGEDSNAAVREDTMVRFYITSTVTSSSHGFEYEGSGDDYTNALPENGGIPDPDKKTLATGGGQVFVSSTDVKGNFEVGNFFKVEQSTGAVTFNPETLELTNLTKIGPFRTNGLTGNNFISDMTNNHLLMLSDGQDEFSPAPDNETIASVAAIRLAINKRVEDLTERVDDTLTQATNNNKVLEALRNPINDLGAWAVRHTIHHRDVKVRDRESFILTSTNLNDDDTESFNAEFGGSAQDHSEEVLSEFRTRASYTVNIVLDTSESMSNSGLFAQIKSDLLTLFYNFDQNDSISIYKATGTRMNTRHCIIDASPDEFLDSANGTFAPQNLPRTATINYSTPVENNTFTLRDNPNNNNTPTCEIVACYPQERKIEINITDGNGFSSGNLLAGSTLDVGGGDPFGIETVEPGIVPEIFSIADSPTIVAENPSQDYTEEIRNGLLRSVGVVVPTDTEVFERNLLEARVSWLKGQSIDTFWEGFDIYPLTWEHEEWNENSGYISQTEEFFDSIGGAESGDLSNMVIDETLIPVAQLEALLLTIFQDDGDDVLTGFSAEEQRENAVNHFTTRIEDGFTAIINNAAEGDTTATETVIDEQFRNDADLPQPELADVIASIYTDQLVDEVFADQSSIAVDYITTRIRNGIDSITGATDTEINDTDLLDADLKPILATDIYDQLEGLSPQAQKEAAVNHLNNSTLSTFIGSANDETVINWSLFTDDDTNEKPDAVPDLNFVITKSVSEDDALAGPKYLPPRTSLTTYPPEDDDGFSLGADYISEGESIRDFLPVFNNNDDGPTDPEGYLTYSDFDPSDSDTTFLREIPSNPQVDVCFVFQDKRYSRRRFNALADNFRNLFTNMSEQGVLDWRVGKLRYRWGTSWYYIKDIDPDNQSFGTVADKKSMRSDDDRAILPVESQHRYYKNNLRFANTTGDGNIDTSTISGNTLDAGVARGEFYLDVGTRVIMPIRQGTPLRITQTYDSGWTDNTVFPLGNYGGEWDFTWPYTAEGVPAHFAAGDTLSISIIGGSNFNDSRIFFTTTMRVARDANPGDATIRMESQNIRNEFEDYCQGQGFAPRDEIMAVNDATYFPNGDGSTHTVWGTTFTHGQEHPFYQGLTIRREREDGSQIGGGEEGFGIRIGGGTNRADDVIDLEVTEDFVPSEGITVDWPSGYMSGRANDSGFIKVRAINNDNSQWDSAVGGADKVIGGIQGSTCTTYFNPDQVVAISGRGARGKANHPTYDAVAAAAREMKWRQGSTKVIIHVDAYANETRYTYGSLDYGRNHSAVYGANNDGDERQRMRRHDELVLQHYRYKNRIEDRGENPSERESRFPTNELDLLYILSLENKRFDAAVSGDHPNDDFAGLTLLDLDANSITHRYINGQDINDGDTGANLGNRRFRDVSFLAEELARHGIDQYHGILHNRTYFEARNYAYDDTDGYPEEITRTIRPFHRHVNMTNFNNSIVRNILQVRAGFAGEELPDAFEEEQAYIDNGEPINDFSDVMPSGRAYNFWDFYHRRNTTMVSDLITDFNLVVGEGTGTLYSDVSDASAGSEFTADEPPIYEDRIEIGTVPQGEDTETSGVETEITRKWPTPSILPSPSVGPRGVLGNSTVAGDYARVPGTTLSGKSAIYENIIAAKKDLTPDDALLQMNLDPRANTQFFGRNPSRDGTINITAVISDGVDNDSFGDQIIPYNYVDGVNPTTELKRLFQAIFTVPGTGRIHKQGDNFVPQKLIYTSDVLNLLRAVHYSYSDGEDTNLDLGNAGVTFYTMGEDDEGLTTLQPFGGRQENLRKAINILAPDNRKPGAVDNIGSMIPIYRGAGDASDFIIQASTYDRQASPENLSPTQYFPNPYVFTSIAIPANQTPGNRNITGANIFTFLAEEGPDITITFYPDVISISSDYDIPREDIPAQVSVTLHSKLGLFHKNLRKTGSAKASDSVVILDPGYNQRLSLNNQVLAQNVDGRGAGTLFKSPETILGDAEGGKLVNRNDNDVPKYRKNPGKPLFEQRVDYIEAFMKNAVQKDFVSGAPLVSRRYVGTQTSGEYLASPFVANIGGIGGDDAVMTLFVTRADTNGNERNAVYETTTDDLGDFEWEESIGLKLRTGGTGLTISSLSNQVGSLQFGESSTYDTPLVVLQDERSDKSKVMALSDNLEDWVSIADKDKGDIDIKESAGDYLNQVLQMNDVAGDDVLILLKRDDVANLSDIYITINDFSDEARWVRIARSYDILDNDSQLRSDEYDRTDFERFSVRQVNTEGVDSGVYFWDPDYQWDRDNVDGIVNDIDNGDVIPMDGGGRVSNFEGIPFNFDPFQEVIGSVEERFITVIGDDESINNGVWRYPNPNDGEDSNYGKYLDQGAWRRDTSYDQSTTLNGSDDQELYEELSLNNQTITRIAPWVFDGTNHLVALVQAEDSSRTQVVVCNINQRYRHIARGDLDNQIGAWNAIGDEHPRTVSEGDLNDNDGFETLIANVNGDDIEVVDNNCQAVGMVPLNNEIIVGFGDDMYASNDDDSITGNKLLIYRDNSGFGWDDITPTEYTPGDGGSEHGAIQLLFLIDIDDEDATTAVYDYGFVSLKGGDPPEAYLFLHNTDGTWRRLTIVLENATYQFNPPVIYRDTLVFCLGCKDIPEQNQIITVRTSDIDGASNGEILNTDLGIGNDATANLRFRPLNDPTVYPRFPHGDNWLRDVMVGVNRGEITATSPRESEDFNWNASRYRRNNMFGTLESQTNPYRRSLI